MPSEPLNLDGKDFLRDNRKHQQQQHGHESLTLASRWRDSSSSISSLSGGSHRNNYNNDFSPRWGYPSEFRRGPGYGKQGGCHMYPEDTANGYPTARSGDRFMDDNGFRPSFPRGDGRYGRFHRENRVPFIQKEWRGHSSETNHHQSVPLHAPGRAHLLSDKRSVEDSPRHTSHPHSDPREPGDSKDQDNKAADVNGSGTVQRLDKQNSLGSLDWKPLKWTRSGSLASRGSGSSHPSGSKSLGGETRDLKGDIPQKNLSPVRSTSGDTAACAPASSPLEDTASRKKARLGWGEGLAKYEKKKVEGPEEHASKVANTTSHSNVELTHSLTSNLVDKSPRVPGMSDCSSPATPSSVACSSSPGLEDKVHVKTADADGDPNNSCASSMDVAEKQLDGHISLEKLKLDSISNLSSLLCELLQLHEQCYTDSTFVKPVLNKLLLWKGDISKELEMAETEIDSLENVSKSLKSGGESSSPCQPSEKALSADDSKGEPCGIANMIPRPPPLEVVSSEVVNDVGQTCPLPHADVQSGNTQNKDEDIDSPGTATSKFEEPHTVQMSAFAESYKNCSSEHMNLPEPTRIRTQNMDMRTDMEDTGGTYSQGDVRNMIEVGSNPGVSRTKDDVCDMVIASNKESAAKASEVLRLLPSNDCHMDFEEAKRASCVSSSDSRIEERFFKKQLSLKFKEKVMAFKYRALQQIWKEDLRSLSLRSQRMKLQKKNDLSLGVMHSGIQKHRSSIRSRFSSSAGNLSQAPMADIINFSGKQLSETPVKIHRGSLKMPAMVLDDKDKFFSRFVSNNGLVEDPCVLEKERALINPWTVEEREIFMDKLVIHGKDFSKIASFLNHKTTADCIEFYYKNHKSESFEKTKKKPEQKKQVKPLSSNTYLVTSEKKWSREMNAASLDLLGAASAIAAQADEAMKSSRLLSGKFSNRKPRMSVADTILETSSSHYVAEDERETVAADALAGICGSFSSEAMSSCITSSIDHGDGNHQERRQQRFGSRRPLTAEVTQSIDDDAYSDESCGEMDPTVDWADDEKSLFVQAFSLYGRDFAMVSQHVQTKTRDQCKVFFSKARKCLGLDRTVSESGTAEIHASNDANSGGSDAEDACVVEADDSVVCSEKPSSRMDEDSSHLNQDGDKPEVEFTESNKMDVDCASEQLVQRHATKDLLQGNHQADASGLAILDDEVTDLEDTKSAAGDDSIARDRDQLITDVNVSTVGATASVTVRVEPMDGKSCYKSVNGVSVSCSPIDVCQQSASRDNVHRSLVVGGSVATSQGEYSQIMKSFPMNVSTSAEMNGDNSRKVRSGTEVRSFQNIYLRKCIQAPSQNVAVGEFPFLVNSEDQTEEHGFSCFSKTDKSSRNGDVKLFGKILSKPTSTDTPTVNEDDKAARLHLTTGNFNMKQAGSQDTSTPDSAAWTLTNKYPAAAFTNYFIPSPKTDQLLLQANANGCNMNMNGFSPRMELSINSSSSSNGSAVEHPVYRKNQEVVQQPFRLDMKQRQDMFPDVNGFELMSSSLPQAQQGGKGLVKLNVVQGQGQGQGGDIVVGSPCTDISDPVKALKLHYARAQQYGHDHGVGGGRNNGIVREETWRGQGDVGR